jgi:hypothetical protein
MRWIDADIDVFRISVADAASLRFSLSKTYNSAKALQNHNESKKHRANAAEAAQRPKNDENDVALNNHGSPISCTAAEIFVDAMFFFLSIHF